MCLLPINQNQNKRPTILKLGRKLIHNNYSQKVLNYIIHFPRQTKIKAEFSFPHYLLGDPEVTANISANDATF